MNEAAEQYTPPARFLLFANALEPLRATFERRLAASPPTGEYVAEPLGWSQRICERWPHHVR